MDNNKLLKSLRLLAFSEQLKKSMNDLEQGDDRDAAGYSATGIEHKFGQDGDHLADITSHLSKHPGVQSVDPLHDAHGHSRLEVLHTPGATHHIKDVMGEVGQEYETSHLGTVPHPIDPKFPDDHLHHETKEPLLISSYRVKDDSINPKFSQSKHDVMMDKKYGDRV